jgi:integrase
MSEAFTKKLEKQLDGLSKNTIQMYLTKLRILNDNEPVKSLAFVKKVETIKAKLERIENDNTRKSYVASIVAVLNRQDDKASKKANDKYKAMFMKERSIFAEKQALGEKSETQKANWLEQDEVVAIHKALDEKVDAIENKTKLTEKEHKMVDDWLLLSLYVLQPPRRNADYYMMKLGMGTDKNFNYVDVDKGVYMFNNFKTSKSHGAEEIPIPDKMKPIFQQYLEMTGLKAGDFILFQKDTRRTSSNSITKALNRILGKRVGASMLRHIFLTQKYGDVKDEMKDDAKFMSHSVNMQANYVLK